MAVLRNERDRGSESAGESRDAVPLTREQIKRLGEWWQDEIAAAELYRALADVADPDRREIFLELAATEERHAAHWEAKLRGAGIKPEARPMSRRNRLLVWSARRFGVDRVLGTVIRAEAADRDRYRATAEATAEMADEEAGHARTLALASAPSAGAALAMAEGRHRTGAGGGLRAAVFGANDGLVSNFALIMGVAGGTTDGGFVLLAGVAGLVAGAGSMAAGEWISVRSQRELYEREIAVERQELIDFPEDERRELELIYRAKGVEPEAASAVADRIMADPETALNTLAREELGLDPDDLGSPWVAAISSFLSFAVGALIPLLPFIFAAGFGALATSAVLSGLALVTIGAALSIFTGRSALWSGLRMVLIGGTAAVVTYAIGALVGVGLG